MVREWRDALRTHSPEAIDLLLKALHAVDENGQPNSVAVKAAEVLIEHAWGKAPQAVALTGTAIAGPDMSRATDDELRQIEAIGEVIAERARAQTAALPAAQATVDAEKTEVGK